MLPTNALAILQQIVRTPGDHILIMALGSLEEGGETIELSVQPLDQDEPTSSLIQPKRFPRRPVHNIDPNELNGAPSLEIAWDLLQPFILGGSQGRPRRFLCWDPPRTLQLLRASLQGEDPVERLRMGNIVNLSVLFQEIGCQYDPSTGDLMVPRLEDLLQAEGLAVQGTLFPVVDTGKVIKMQRNLVLRAGRRVVGNTRSDETTNAQLQHLVSEAATYINRKFDGRLSFEDGEAVLIGAGAAETELHGQLWQRGLSQKVFLSFLRMASRPDVLRISAYPLVYGEPGRGLGDVPMGLELCFDQKRRCYYEFHFATADDSPPRPALKNELPVTWGSIAREPNGERLVGPWGIRETAAGLSTPQLRAPELFAPLTS